MGASKCTHGFDSYWACAECMYGDETSPPEVAKPAPKAVSRFEARYDGKCDGCGRPIVPGDWIVRMDNDEYRHEECE